VRPLRFPPVRVVARAPEVLEARARALARSAGAVEDAGAVRAMVAFRAAGVACALDLSLIEKAVVRLGDVDPLAHASAASSILGVAFVDNLPHLVADLASPDAPRSLLAVSRGPALVVRLGEAGLAVAVEGPVELTEAPVSGGSGGPEGLRGHAGSEVRVDGRLADGTLRISEVWFRQWIAGLRAGGDA